ncbi:MAG: 3-deoxy-D-manno-octulosonate 8-phosphate phosphatase [Bacteroidia bacterium]|jgi:3-deoxy-D-manno-octulosonate 8-phosphate phosphatase (KDO 8-P phosphatase)|nr:3-deoxy-D-manno-octulosonate 8-phosphate phosphatase [Bacteroidia bacterium]
MAINYKQALTKITTFIFDIDGVLTNNTVFINEQGELLRNMHSKDGYAIQLAIKKGYKIIIISGGNNEPVKKVLERAGVQHVFIRQSDKLQCYTDFLIEHSLSDKEIMYMGDDLPDWHVMSRVAVAACPNDAATEIKEISQYISDKKGGEGCVRDIIEQTMRAQQTWEIANW